jgi:hypothetical protein
MRVLLETPETTVLVATAEQLVEQETQATPEPQATRAITVLVELADLEVTLVTPVMRVTQVLPVTTVLVGPADPAVTKALRLALAMQVMARRGTLVATLETEALAVLLVLLASRDFSLPIVLEVVWADPGHRQMAQVRVGQAGPPSFSILRLTFEMVLPALRGALDLAVVAVAVLVVDSHFLVVAEVAVAVDQAMPVMLGLLVAPEVLARLALTVTLDQLARAQLLVVPVVVVARERQAMQEQTATPVLEPQVVEPEIPVQLVQTDQLAQLATPVQELQAETPALVVMPAQQVM